MGADRGIRHGQGARAKQETGGEVEISARDDVDSECVAAICNQVLQRNKCDRH